MSRKQQQPRAAGTTEQPPPAARPSPWHYRRLRVADGGLEAGLAALGLDGWELVAAVRRDGPPHREAAWELILKRPG